MVMWQTWKEGLGPDAWNDALFKASDAHPFQCFYWGEYKRLGGWRPVHYVARSKDGKIIGMAQVLVKKKLGLNLAWIPGAVARQFPAGRGQAEVLNPLVDTLRENLGPCYIRFNFSVPHDHACSYELGHSCRRPPIRLAGGYSALIDLDRDEETLVSDFSSKHRYYVKKSQAQDIAWRSGNTPELAAHLAGLLHEIVASKKVSAIYFSREEIETLCRLAGNQAVILVGYMADKPVTACLVLTAGDFAFYQIAATGAEGRQAGAAYAMIRQLLPTLKTCGIKRFDFGGLNPQDKNASGVSHFKRGFGGSVVEYLGEWESATSPLLELIVNAGILLRGNRL